MFSDDLLSKIRSNAGMNNINIDRLYFVVRNETNLGEFKRNLRVLETSMKIRVDTRNGIITPNYSEAECIELKKTLNLDVRVDLHKVRMCIREFFVQRGIYPKPSDVEEQFILMFGRPKQADFTRMLRDWAEDGILLRTEDNRYYFKNINVPEVGLNNWARKI